MLMFQKYAEQNFVVYEGGTDFLFRIFPTSLSLSQILKQDFSSNQDHLE